MSKLHDHVLDYLRRHAPDSLAFLTGPGQPPEVDVLSVCDTLYTLKFLGRMDLLASDVGVRFTRLLQGHEMAGGIGQGRGPKLGVHKTAYVLGVLNLLETSGHACHRAILCQTGWKKHQLLNKRTDEPRWPWYFTHHAWRIGHWIGGIPSIVMSLWRLVPDLAAQNQLPSVDAVLSRSDGLLDKDTGMFHAYRAAPLQHVFRQLYSYRHDPDAGDIGGVAHLHWLNYASGRLPYKAAPAVFDRVWSLLERRRPFMENVPYCLDFDVVQLARTAIPDGDPRSGALRARMSDYSEDIAAFYGSRLGGDYKLHKLPGGLATLHECALAADLDEVPELAIAPVDIAREAHWI